MCGNGGRLAAPLDQKPATSCVSVSGMTKTTAAFQVFVMVTSRLFCQEDLNRPYSGPPFANEMALKM